MTVLRSGGAVCRRPLSLSIRQRGVSDPLLGPHARPHGPPRGSLTPRCTCHLSVQAAACLLRKPHAVAEARCQLSRETGVQEGRRRPHTARSFDATLIVAAHGRPGLRPSVTPPGPHARERLASRHCRSLSLVSLASKSRAAEPNHHASDDGLGLVPIKAPRCARPTLTRGFGLDGILD
jgi:hypothetical protein